MGCPCLEYAVDAMAADPPTSQREEGIILLYRLVVLALYCLLGFLQ